MSIFGNNWWSPLWMIENVFKLNWGSAASAAVSVVGGMMGDDAAGDAAGEQSAAAEQAINEIRKIGDRTRSDTEPYRALGKGSANKLSYLLGIGPKEGTDRQFSLADFEDRIARNPLAFGNNTDASIQYDDYINKRRGKGGALDLDDKTLAGMLGFDYVEPYQGAAGEYGSLLNQFSLADLNKDVVYNKALQFGLDEGLKSLDRRQLALGGYDSGAGIKAATRYANDYGETKAAGAQARFMGDKQFTLNSLLGTTGVGQNAVALDANTGSQMAQAIGGAQMGAGNARAAGIVGGANAWGNAASGVSNVYNTYKNNQQTDRILNAMGA